jgi:hypothetical protein
MLSPILWAALACVMFTSPARATTAPDDGHSPSSPANAESAADGAAQRRDPLIKSKRSGVPQPPRTGAQPSAGSNGRTSAEVASRRGLETPQPGIQQRASGSADRVHSLMSTRARGYLVRQTSRPIGSNHAAAGGLGLRRPGSARAVNATTPPESKRNALPVPRLTTMPRNSAIGGPRVQSVGRLGGPALGRANRSAPIDGTQFHRKF